MGTVIGPIDHATWYCMRQCRECINYLKPKAVKNPVHLTEIKGEEELLRVYMSEVLGRKVA